MTVNDVIFPYSRFYNGTCIIFKHFSNGQINICNTISGKQTCYSGWKAEYTGFLMTENRGHNNKDYVCVDKDAESLNNDSSNKNGALFYPVRTTCGSLRCPPYKTHTEMVCVVCTT